MSYQYEDQLIQVLVEDDNGKESKVIAKIIRRQDECTFVIKYLSPTGSLYEDFCRVYEYEETSSIVEDESILIWFDTKDEEKVGFKKMDKNTFITMEDYEDMDDDYIPSDNNNSSEDESLVDSDEYYDDDSDSDSDSDNENQRQKKDKNA